MTNAVQFLEETYNIILGNSKLPSTTLNPFKGRLFENLTALYLKNKYGNAVSKQKDKIGQGDFLVAIDAKKQEKIESKIGKSNKLPTKSLPGGIETGYVGIPDKVIFCKQKEKSYKIEDIYEFNVNKQKYYEQRPKIEEVKRKSDIRNQKIETGFVEGRKRNQQAHIPLKDIVDNFSTSKKSLSQEYNTFYESLKYSDIEKILKETFNNPNYFPPQTVDAVLNILSKFKTPDSIYNIIIDAANLNELRNHIRSFLNFLTPIVKSSEKITSVREFLNLISDPREYKKFAIGNKDFFNFLIKTMANNEKQKAEYNSHLGKINNFLKTIPYSTIRKVFYMENKNLGLNKVFLYEDKENITNKVKLLSEGVTNEF